MTYRNEFLQNVTISEVSSTNSFRLSFRENQNRDYFNGQAEKRDVGEKTKKTKENCLKCEKMQVTRPKFNFSI